MGDDFCIDEDAGVIYLATHRQNSIDRISMDPGDNSGFSQVVVGDPFTEALIGPCSVARGRAPGKYGKVAYVISDGGTASPAPGGPLPARLQRWSSRMARTGATVRRLGVGIESYADGDGPTLVALPSHDRDGGGDRDHITTRAVQAGRQVLRQ